MKFAKELEDDLVPEWRAKYINYKQGKKKIKAVSKALRTANRTPKITGKPPLSHVSSTATIPYTHYDFKSRSERKANGKAPAHLFGQSTDGASEGRAQYANARRMSTTMFTTSPPIHGADENPDSSSDSGPSEEVSGSDESDEERTPLKRTSSGKSFQEMPPSYGSFDSPTKDDPPSPETSQTPGRMTTLALPDPALDPGRERTQSPELTALQQQRSVSEHDPRRAKDKEQERPEPTKSNSQPLMRQIVQRKVEQNKPVDKKNVQTKSSTSDRIRKIFRPKNINSPDMTTTQQNAYQELDHRQDDFFEFLDKELDKIEKFYMSKEDEAHDRLNALRAQLHEHRDQRARDMKLERQGRHNAKRQDDEVSHYLHETPLPSMPKNDVKDHTQNGNLFKKVLKNEPKVGKTSKAMNKMATPPTSPHTQAQEGRRDYTKKKPTVANENVPYRFAKRRLKLALQEFYRGMELLKSYALLNRTGFRKINKKYDKAVNARPPLRYLNEKVSEANFVKSTRIDEYLVAVEDLYARYFERGNRKVAVNKLRSKLQQGDHSGSTFRNGLYLAAGAGLAVAGLVNGLEILFNDPRSEVRVATSYLLQMYAGYFLSLLLFLLFVVDCKIWTMSRINYIFVFEYDTRHVLDWRQLAEIPCFFFFLNGLFIWLNFEFGVGHSMYHYWPVILFGLTLIIMAFPFKVLYYHSRKWWGFSNFRLLFAGIYPVEFRDFFLGDMYCSETYAMSQIEVFFCVYRWNWDDPPRCNSSHSKLLGFFTTLPAIWRFMQCLRRYRDSGNWFPHLANGAKYTCNIVYYMSLSLYRLHLGTDVVSKYKAAFIFFAALNGLYCAFWDVFMDWSLGNPFAKHVGLRSHLTFRRKWVYWAAIVFDVVMRHQWIVYAIFTEDLQHNTAMSFFVGLAEVLRRGVWSIFRVENEHTNNVTKFRASRDIPLPYSLQPSPLQKAQAKDTEDFRRRKPPTPGDQPKPDDDDRATTTGADHDLERQTTTESGSTIRRRMSNTPALNALRRVGTVIAAAHSQDFQKKRRPEVVGHSPDDDDETNMHRNVSHMHDSSDEDDDDDDDRADIDGSVIGQDSDREESPGGGRHSQPHSHPQHHHRGDRDHHAEEAAVEDDPGEGSSGDNSSNGNNRAADERDIDEARRIAFEYQADAGLRGADAAAGSSSRRRKGKKGDP